MAFLGLHYTIFDTGWEDAEHFTLTYFGGENGLQSDQSFLYSIENNAISTF